ncbi:MAG: hypothetical protein DMD81_16410 [Candidatus Rokuibacteriota bacterium]|nr:MAG: hypothetical protein DMD81_16410 [Candidatus Rokubacteria bacterium]
MPNTIGRERMTASTSVRKVAVALFEGFTVLDVYGPVQAFASARLTGPDGARIRLFEIFTMAERRGEVKSSEGPATHADFSFGDAPDFDILLIPGGFGSRTQVERPQFLSELARASERARVTTTVCTGSRAPVGSTSARPPATRSRGTGSSSRARACTGNGRRAGSTTATS